MKNQTIVWGACWFNESVETLITFFQETIKNLSSRGYNVYPVIFDAKLEHNSEDINQITEKVKNVLILKNKINIYPNKNYGVAAITEYAHRIHSKYLAIVDPDWDIKEYTSFINNLFSVLVDENIDIVIPNIKGEAGRSNLLIGKVAISLFYPEYTDIIKTAFPGSLIGITEKIYQITSSPMYHYDWGGEWDIISLAINNNFKLASSPIDVINVRHRGNSSKILDAYQIWRAILSNDNLKERISNLETYNKKIRCSDELAKKILDKQLSSKEQINIINKYATNETQRQLLYMILYPLATILEEIKYIPNVEQNDKLPYKKDKLIEISDLAIYCFKSAILSSNKTIEEINKSAKKMTNNLWSNWNKETQSIAINNIKEDLNKGGIL